MIKKKKMQDKNITNSDYDFKNYTKYIKYKLKMQIKFYRKIKKIITPILAIRNIIKLRNLIKFVYP